MLNMPEKIILGDAAKKEHVVRFYDDDAFLLTEVADFIDMSLCSGGGGIIIATPDHVRELQRRLAGFGSAPGRKLWSCEKLITLNAQKRLINS